MSYLGLGSQYAYLVQRTEFLDDLDKNWYDGPNLPHVNSYHAVVVLNEDEVMTFGGSVQAASLAAHSNVWYRTVKNTTF